LRFVNLKVWSWAIKMVSSRRSPWGMLCES